MDAFKLVSEFEPRGDQPAAIEKITTALRAGEKYQCLLGVTGSGIDISRSAQAKILLIVSGGFGPLIVAGSRKA